MSLPVPKTNAEWRAVAQRVKQSTAKDFPDIAPDKYEQFKKAFLGGKTHTLWYLIGFGPLVLLFLVPEYLLGQRVPAIVGIVTLVWAILAGIILASWKDKAAVAKLGQEIGFFAR